MNDWKDDLRLIESGFPCHQVGAETQRERGASSALPPLYFLHVWWARRPLTPSRAAILASLLPADTDPDWFLRQLGIEKRVVEINEVQWTLTGKILDRMTTTQTGEEILPVDQVVLNCLEKENKRRNKNAEIIAKLQSDPDFANDEILSRWKDESTLIPEPWPENGDSLTTRLITADPSHIKARIQFAKLDSVKRILGYPIKWDPEDLYGYNRAFTKNPAFTNQPKVILDPTSGGGSIPFEALRMGHQVFANELNPVASVILNATLKFPARFGPELSEEIESWGNLLNRHVSGKMEEITPFSPLPSSEKAELEKHCQKCPEVIDKFDVPEYDQTGLLYCRQVTCPDCGGDAPLLNTCWLSKEDEKQWGVRIIPDGRKQNGNVRFETYKATKGKGPKGEDPNLATVNNGVGTCVHCRQAIDANEIKSQARGESPHGTWQDRLYCVVAVRFEPKLDKEGKPQRYKSGHKKGEIKTQKIRFFRPPNRQDLDALTEAEQRLKENWDRWEVQGLIPTEKIPLAHKTKEPLRVGMNRWCDMFTPRQLLGHLTLVEELNRLKPEILSELGEEKGRAVITYLQFAIDKGLDYNSRQTRWEYTRGIVKGNFGRHDFSLKWTFGEMVFAGPRSGFSWCLSQISDSYKGMAGLTETCHSGSNVRIKSGTAAYMPYIEDGSVDLICMDPPYYNNVQYAELSDFFYVWQRRTLQDLYPECYKRRLTDKRNEAVANPDRDGGAKPAHQAYENMMTEIFTECRRAIKPSGVLTLMFTHKSQDAWEALTRSLIESGWTITATVPVEAESTHSMHLMEKAGAVSSVFLSCRKRKEISAEPAYWSGFGGTGVQQRIQEAVKAGLKEFEPLYLNPVDEMVASYGRALRVLSEKWPVMDKEEQVSPVRAMNEASRVVSENQIRRITGGRLNVEDLSPEAAMAVTLFGIYRLAEIPYDDALNISKSLNIAMENKTGGYEPNGRFIGYNTQTGGSRRSSKSEAEDTGFQAPLVRKGSKLRLARPEERHDMRIEYPRTEWDILNGLIMAYRKGDIPVARAYLDRQAEGRKELILDLLQVWTKEISDDELSKEGRAIAFGLK